MAKTVVELNKTQVEQILGTALASARRGVNTAKNDAFRLLFEKEAKEISAAMATLTEVK